ncbi:MAG: ribonuclease III [Acidobacteria bacterium]|nr:ribonuclease III [Acidobacteriota bacterium]
MFANLNDLEKVIGHSFRDIKLLERAVTHRSWAFENLPGADETGSRQAENEVLEFVGDSVVGLAVAEELFALHPTLDEGGLTLMKHHLVSTATLAAAGEAIEIGKFLRVGRGEEKTGGRKKRALLANTIEAVIGAVFLDSGYIAARTVVKRLIGGEIKAATPERSLDYKSLLQERLQGAKLNAPVYSLINTDGPPHERIFFVEAVWEGGSSRGEGRSIKAAEMLAARAALDSLASEASGNDN